MRYLLINEFREQGGSEVQSLRERDLLRSKGHEVLYLTFDPKFDMVIEGCDLNIPLHYSGFSLLYHRIFVDKNLKVQLDSIITGFSPQVIHVNNAIAAAATVYACVKPYHCFQTIRDYGAVCPKDTCVHEDWSICRGFTHEPCFRCIGFNLKYQVKSVCLRVLTKRRLASLDRFVCPSKALSSCCTDNGIPTDTLNNPFDFSVVRKSKPCLGKTYLYYGSISERKGVTALLDAWEEFAALAPDAQLLLAGKIVDEYQAYFKDRINAMPSATYVGSMSNAEIMELYKRIYCVVVPSFWIENYPNTVLEALANKTLVIGSNRGGIPELIESEDCLFDVLDKHSIVRTLSRSYDMSESEYATRTGQAYQRCLSRNSLASYYQRIMGICDGLLRSEGETR